MKKALKDITGEDFEKPKQLKQWMDENKLLLKKHGAVIPRVTLALLLLLAVHDRLRQQAERSHSLRRAQRRAMRSCVFLERLAEEADAKGDVLAAQALAETCLHVSGVPHPNEDALREAVIDGIPGSADETAWITQQWQAMAPHVAVLGASSRDWDVLDARLVAQFPLVLPQRASPVNAARVAMGLRGHALRREALDRETSASPARPCSADQTRKDLGAARCVATVIPVAPAGGHDAVPERTRPCSVGLFDPGDKGITFGTWPRREAVAPPDRRGGSRSSNGLEVTCSHASCIGCERQPQQPLRRGHADCLRCYPRRSTKPLHRWETVHGRSTR